MNLQIDSYDLLTPEQAQLLGALINTLVQVPVVVPPVGPAPVEAAPVEAAPVEAASVEAPPAKRKRRTKAQIAADNRQKEADAAVLAAAKGTDVVATEEDKATPVAVPAETASAPPSGAVSPGIMTSDMKTIVVNTLDRLTKAGDPNPTKSVVGELTRVSGKKRISEIGEDMFAVVALSLNNLEYEPPADDSDPLG